MHRQTGATQLDTSYLGPVPPTVPPFKPSLDEPCMEGTATGSRMSHDCIGVFARHTNFTPTDRERQWAALLTDIVVANGWRSWPVPSLADQVRWLVTVLSLATCADAGSSRLLPPVTSVCIELIRLGRPRVRVTRFVTRTLCYGPIRK